MNIDILAEFFMWFTVIIIDQRDRNTILSNDQIINCK